ncbi:T-cell immunoglobulin and mucin domain-containing protein 4-like [Bufo gargarizans]|uniref:T-cell immunoglobulin and mucin domain-containing protein 4-like n=1 Tax=Bufo gargarizans TaxID=30331 RepID=UPI001CF479A3|nr:T-cell immunoglobulin and mucin domain-containing protein 4-like [Bufo gargarizans]
MKFCMSWRENLQVSFLLLSCSVTVLCQETVKGIEGQPVTLPCSYRVSRSSDLTSMCWGQGSCPNSKCSQQLIWTDGFKVTFRSSSRYQLKHKIRQGIVSLTIDQASLGDTGTYCCRIEHKGWFNDEKNNIQLTVEKAPTTTVQTTTEAPTTMKTSQALPTPTSVQTTSGPSYVSTNPLTISVEVTTQPPPLITNNTPQPLSPLTKTDIPSSSTARTITSSTNVFPSVMTEHTGLTRRSSAIPGFIPDHELTTSVESKAKVKEHTEAPLWTESLSANNNGISDLFHENVTTLLKKNTSTIIIAISVFLIVLIVICVMLLKLKGQKRGRYLLGFDPHLELVTHVEEPPSEIQAEEADPNKAEEDKAETNHIGNTSEAKD